MTGEPPSTFRRSAAGSTDSTCSAATVPLPRLFGALDPDRALLPAWTSA